jgi:putative transposase
MSRPPRPDIPGIPQHVVQRGNNRLPCFLDDDDRLFYLAYFRLCLEKHGCALHAYVLMSNHVHLLLTPSLPGAVPRLMQEFGSRYTARFNQRHHRTGSLWEGRYRACLVDSDAYLLACHRYIEANPVRAGMVLSPEDYRWSSHCANAWGAADPLLTPHLDVLSLAGGAGDRFEAYRSLFDADVPAEQLASMRLHLRQRAAWGSDAFRQRVEATTERFAGVREAHRPAKKSA